jgi:hypothetical protein
MFSECDARDCNKHRYCELPLFWCCKDEIIRRIYSTKTRRWAIKNDDSCVYKKWKGICKDFELHEDPRGQLMGVSGYVDMKKVCYKCCEKEIIK